MALRKLARMKRRPSNVLIQEAFFCYLEDMADYREVIKRKKEGGEPISLEELEKELFAG
ncbi:hypothetical protein [Hydrogenimonas sp.]